MHSEMRNMQIGGKGTIGFGFQTHTGLWFSTNTNCGSYEGQMDWSFVLIWVYLIEVLWNPKFTSMSIFLVHNFRLISLAIKLHFVSLTHKIMAIMEERAMWKLLEIPKAMWCPYKRWWHMKRKKLLPLSIVWKLIIYTYIFFSFSTIIHSFYFPTSILAFRASLISIVLVSF
jgi:hypothetical protein